MPPCGYSQSVSIFVITPKLFMPCMMMPPKLVLPKLPFMYSSSRCSGLKSSEASQNWRIVSRVGEKGVPFTSKPAASWG